MSDTMTLTIEHTSAERRLLDHLSELGMRDTATILGTGAMGEPAWPYIPIASWLCGVNGAVEIHCGCMRVWYSIRPHRGCRGLSVTCVNRRR
jgi:hypothetical protein